MTWDDGGYGLAWPAILGGGRLTVHEGDEVQVAFESTVVETVESVALFVDGVQSGRWRLVVDDPDPEPAEFFLPDADESNGGWVDQGTATSDLFEAIDDTSLNTSDYIESDGIESYRFHVGSGSYTAPSGFRPVKVELFVVVSEVGGENTELTLGVGDEDSADIAVASGAELQTFSFARTSGLSESFVQNLASTESLHIAQSDGAGALRVFQAFVEVTVAYAQTVDASITSEQNGWRVVPLQTSWSKLVQPYVLRLVKHSGGGRLVWPTLSSDGVVPVGGWQVGETFEAPGVAFIDDSDDASVDSQPYVRLNREQVFDGRTVEQEITGDALTAGWVETVVARHPNCTADLVVELRKRSDGGLVGTATFEAALLADSPRRLRQLGGVLDLANGGSVDSSQHYLVWSSDAVEAAPWEVGVLDAAADERGDLSDISDELEAVTFGGTTDVATVDGTEHDDQDVPVMVRPRPAAVAGVSATAGTTDGRPSVTVSWTATSLGGDFSHYLIRRNGLALATVSSELTVELVDTGPLPGVQESWSVQVVNTDGAGSEPSEDTATAPVPSGASHWATSLHDPDVDVALRVRSSPDPSFEWAEDRAVRQLLGRDNSLVLRSTVDRGDRIAWTVHLDGDDDRALFDALLALRDADVPYLTVTSKWGRRWFGALLVDEGNLRQVSRIGEAGVTLVETHSRPEPVEMD